MTRSERLLQLLDLLRQRRQAITAESLATKLGISVRTAYRDIESLRNQGADIVGESGMGFVLQHDFMLPPLMFNEDEIESLVLGIRWVMKNGDSELADKAQSALAKINAVLPDALAQQIRQNALHPITLAKQSDDSDALIIIRAALREERLLTFDYRDKLGKTSQRTIRPINVGYFEGLRLVAAWCELRKDFRHFRTDRMTGIRLGNIYPPSRAILEREWQENEGIELQQLDI